MQDKVSPVLSQLISYADASAAFTFIYKVGANNMLLPKS